LIAVTIVAVRRVILFPAIAIDAPGASWSNARRDTKGSSWRVFFILICTMLPVVIVVLLLSFLIGAERYSRPGLALLIINSVLEVAVLCAIAAAASHIFQARADDLARSLDTRPGTS
jgi:hypothetical protein